MSLTLDQGNRIIDQNPYISKLAGLEEKSGATHLRFIGFFF